MRDASGSPRRVPNIGPSPTKTKRWCPTVFAMCIFAGSSRQMAPRQMATRWNQSSSRGKRDAQTVCVQGMTVGDPQRGTPTAKYSQRLGEMHGTKVSNSEPKFRLQARGPPLRRRCPSAQPSPTPTWQAWLWQGVTTVRSSTLVCVLSCLVLACLPLLWTRQCALPFALEGYRCKPSRLGEVRASRCPAGRLAPGGRTGGVRRASLLLLVPWLAVCTAAGTVCSNAPTVCDGTYSGTSLCALPPPFPHRASQQNSDSARGW
jgi:hypothetical protein